MSPAEKAAVFRVAGSGRVIGREQEVAMIAEQQLRRELETRRRRISIVRHPVLTLR